MHAGERDVAQPGIGTRSGLHLEHLAPGRGLGADVQIVLVHAGNSAGEAAGAAVDVQVEGVAHRVTSCAPAAPGVTFFTAQSEALKPGKPEIGSR